VTFAALGVAFAAALCTGCSAAAPNDERTGPPRTDYCEMLVRDVHGEKPGFMAGNKMLYLGGQANVEWKIVENETLGHGGFSYTGLPGKSVQVTITLGETVSRRSSARSVSEADPPGPAPATP